MGGHSARRRAIEAVVHYTPPTTTFSINESPGELFGQNVFSRAEMQKRLPKGVFKSVLATIEHGEPLDPTVADIVASAMKDWAIEKGATHYAHVFYPLTGLTAEKHDSFLEPDGSGASIAEFAGKTLVQGEPDASSFPNGGLRQTFEARGYTAWDVTSPAYILENPNGNTLCIPTVFISWTGEALDKKTPLLRSQQALNAQAQRVLRLFGHTEIDSVVSFAGAEQEYFLVDRHFFYARPDLMASGRTLFGAPPAQGPGVRRPLLRRHPRAGAGVHARRGARAVQAGHPRQDPPQRGRPGPVRDRPRVREGQRRHRPPAAADGDPAPGRREVRHGVPAAREALRRHQRLGQARQLLAGQRDPGQPAQPRRHAPRQRAVPGVLRRGDPGGAQYGGLLRAVVASAANDHRLGANEAPPAIISIFLGEQLADVFDQIGKGGATASKEKGG